VHVALYNETCSCSLQCKGAVMLTAGAAANCEQHGCCSYFAATATINGSCIHQSIHVYTCRSVHTTALHTVSTFTLTLDVTGVYITLMSLRSQLIAVRGSMTRNTASTAIGLIVSAFWPTTCTYMCSSQQVH
jgi:hypothetical protein